MKKDIVSYLEDIVESIAYIERYTNEISTEAFEENELIQDAVIRRFQVIGEASKRVPDEFRKQHTNIPWKLATGMRDVLIHDYSEANFSRIWSTIKEDLPLFKEQVKKLLESADLSDGCI